MSFDCNDAMNESASRTDDDCVAIIVKEKMSRSFI